MSTMEQMDNINVGEACRACLKTCEHYKMLYETDENIDQKSWGEVFSDVVKIEIKANIDSSPSRICYPCTEVLQSAYTFIQKSQQNHQRLLEYLKISCMKQPDCLSENPIDIPTEGNFFEIKIENDSMNDYGEQAPESKESPPSSSGSEESDCDYEGPLLKKQKDDENTNKMQCTYCNRVFKRLDFLENHKKKHEDELRREEALTEDNSLNLNDESSSSKLTLQTATTAPSTARNANNKQMEMLVSFMEKNGDISKTVNNTSAGKIKRNQLWDLLINKLNSLGPPIKSLAEWQKVWTGFKYRTKLKLSNQLRQLSKTGGGPCAEITLSSLEERVNVLSSAEKNVAASDRITTFGAEEKSSKPPVEEKPETSAEAIERMAFEIFADSSIKREAPEIPEIENPEQEVTTRSRKCSELKVDNAAKSIQSKIELFKTFAGKDESFHDELLKIFKETKEIEQAKLLAMQERNEIQKEFLKAYLDHSKQLMELKNKKIRIEVQKLEALLQENRVKLNLQTNL